MDLFWYLILVVVDANLGDGGEESFSEDGDRDERHQEAVESGYGPYGSILTDKM